MTYLLGDSTLAEDLTQEVFIKYMAQSTPLDYPGAWFSKVATRTAYNYMRGEKSRPTVPMSTEENDFTASMADLFSIEDHVIRKEEVLQVRLALKSLSDPQRTCLILKFSGYTYDEIHQATDLAKNQIGQMIARGKEKFLAHYQKEVDSHVLR